MSELLIIKHWLFVGFRGVPPKQHTCFQKGVDKAAPNLVVTLYERELRKSVYTLIHVLW